MNSGSGPTQKCSLVFADDHPLFRFGIMQALHQSDRFEKVIEASNGHEVLDIISTQRIDVVLLDYRMPFLDGYDTAEKILTDYPFIKVILFTMYCDSFLVSNFYKLGIHGFLSKNANIEQLIEAIECVHRNGFYRGNAPLANNGSFKNLPPVSLTIHEKELIRLLSEGLSSEMIGKHINANVRTVENHRAKLQQKLQAKNTSQLIQIAHNLGLL